jgi:hypothetical protein
MIKRPRLVWTDALHQKFIAIVEQLGIDKAPPKTIMQVCAAVAWPPRALGRCSCPGRRQLPAAGVLAVPPGRGGGGCCCL